MLAKQMFSTGDVVRAAGVSNHTLQSWMKRNVVIGHRDADIEGGGSPGLHRRFSFLAVMQIAVAKGLIDASHGMDLKAAFDAAVLFAHGSGPGRLPGHVFHHNLEGKTVLATTGKHTAIIHQKPGQDILADVSLALRGAEGFVLINVGAVFDRVCAALGENPNNVLDEAYPELASD